jgi:hypothetical protein
MNKILVTMLFSLFFAAGISVTENEKIIPEKKFNPTCS